MSTKVSIEFFLPDQFLVTSKRGNNSKAEMLRRFLIETIEKASMVPVKAPFTKKLLEALSVCNIHVTNSSDSEDID